MSSENAVTPAAESDRTDIRTLNGHESWQEVYDLLEVEE